MFVQVNLVDFRHLVTEKSTAEKVRKDAAQIIARINGFTYVQTEFDYFTDELKEVKRVASGGGTGRTLHPGDMAAGPASYGMTDTMERMHSDAQFAASNLLINS